RTIRFTVRRGPGTDDTGWEGMQIEYGSDVRGYAPYYRGVSASENNSVSAISLSEDNIVQDPEAPYFAVNKKARDENAVPVESMEVIDLAELNGVNLFNKDTMAVHNRAINGAGASIVQSGSGHTAFIKIRPNSPILFKKLSGAPRVGFWYSEAGEGG